MIYFPRSLISQFKRGNKNLFKFSNLSTIHRHLYGRHLYGHHHLYGRFFGRGKNHTKDGGQYEKYIIETRIFAKKISPIATVGCIGNNLISGRIKCDHVGSVEVWKILSQTV